ncbi:ABC transporter permease [Paenibacillus glycanilyticus]|uniref:Sulfonate ABC transporter permease n=1 Tax=Paenibacillus glycanilyticus TaxID=126569 RepID=A0ABQ6GG31_9BACL|nr:ABC transporter permease [Paenibacillus glycanilyticus]GLX69793.1 sulfonate ABC transporter permease [Paenibacillus glycanilyticus]
MQITRNRLAFRTVHFLIGMAVPVAVLVIWQLASSNGWVNAVLIPPPKDIADEFGRMLSSGELLTNLRVSAGRALIGFLIGGGLGLAAGLWVGFSLKAERLLDPSLQLLRTLPHLAVAPLFILWFGFGETSKILLIAKGAFFPLYVNAFLGVRSVDRNLFDVARVLQFTRWQTVTKLILPASLPSLFLGIRLSIAVSWLGLVVAEMMGSSSGIGYIINDARSFSLTSVIFVGIIVFAVVGKATDSLVRLAENRLLRWRDSLDGEG